MMSDPDLNGDQEIADDLTWREQDVLNLLAERLTNREIADRLHLAETTVKDYVSKILGKLYVKNRREAVDKAQTLGLLGDDQESAVRPRSNLPADPTPFIGRLDELEEIKTQLSNTHLLTLTGPGGIGKTRLAIKAANEAVGDFEHGTFFVPLAPIRSADAIIQTMAEAVDFPIATHEDPQFQLLRFLKKKQLLLVLDNFEHMLDSTGIVSEILQSAPAVKILATSREKLNLHSEIILSLSGMTFPDQAGPKDKQNYDAITLFKQSANKVRPGFEPSTSEIEQIAQICQLVDGMPLAIEMAAAWLHIISLDEIAAELERGLDFLATEARDAPERHRSIRTVFDHSWSMLAQEEQKIFIQLSVFRGSITREAVQRVTDASIQQLASLANKSFLNHNPESGRLEMHELLRQYAQEHLEKTPEAYQAAQGRHAAFFADFISQMWKEIQGEKQIPAMAEIEADIENVRAAWRYYLDQGNASQMWKFLKCLWQVYWIRWWNHAGMELFRETARVFRGVEGEKAAGVRALAMAFQAYFLPWLVISPRGYELANESVEILENLDHPEALVLAYNSLTMNAYMLNQYTEMSEASNKMIEVAAQIDDEWLNALTLFGASMVALIMDDPTEAKRLAESNLQISEKIGDAIGSTIPLFLLGHASLAHGENEKARRYYLRCLKIAEEVGFPYSMQTSSKYLGKVTISIGKNEEAEKYLRQSLTISHEIGFVRDIINLLYEFARLWAAQGKPEQAANLLGLVIDHPASGQTRWLEGRIKDNAKVLLNQIEEDLSKDAVTAALKEGREMDLDEVVGDLLGQKSRK